MKVIAILSALLISFILGADVKVGSPKVGVEFAGGSCGSASGSPCPVFKFMPYRKDGTAYPYHIKMEYTGIHEVDANGTVDSVNLVLGTYNINSAKEMTSLPPDFQVVQTDVTNGKKVEMSASLDYIQKKVDDGVAMAALMGYNRTDVETAFDIGMGGNRNWRNTAIKIEHFMATAGSMIVNVDGNQTALVEPDTFKFNIVVEKWPFHLMKQNRLKIGLKFTGSFGKNLVASEGFESPKRVQCTSDVGTFKMDFVTKVAMTSNGNTTLKDVTFVVTDMLNDPNDKCVKVDLIFPPCEDMNDCKIVYDPSISASSDIEWSSGASTFFFNLVLLFSLLVVLLF